MALLKLFRDEAVAHANARLTGEVLLHSSLSLRLLSGVCVASLLAAAAFASLATYARKETISGWVAPAGGFERISAQGSGVVRSVDVQEGSSVAKGATVATLRLSSDLASGDAGEQIVRSINLEAASAEAAAVASRGRLGAQLAELNLRRSSIIKELQEAKIREDVALQKQELAAAAARRGASLNERGFLSASNRDALQREMLTSAEALSVLRSTRMGYERDLQGLGQQMTATRAEIAAADATRVQAGEGLNQRRLAAGQSSQEFARAGRAGRVSAVTVEPGQYVQSGATIAMIVPTGTPLIAEFYVPSRSAGFIAEGQEVRLMYSAFPYQKFGTGRGLITSISSSVIAPSDAPLPAQALQEPIFRVRAKIDQPSVRAYGKVVPLKPGMGVTADVVIDRRNLVQWLLDPLYAAGRRG